MKKTSIILFGFLFLALILLGFFFWFLSYSSVTDFSDDARFRSYLNKPIVVKQASVILLNADNSNRFSKYFIDLTPKGYSSSGDLILKEFKIGDTIYFNSAKRYSSNHVGDSYYFLGNADLVFGETIEFEYGVSFDLIPAIWESEEDFLNRRKLKKDFPQ